MNDLFPAFGSQNTTTQFGASAGWFLDITDLSLIHHPLKLTIRVYTTAHVYGTCLKQFCAAAVAAVF